MKNFFKEKVVYVMSIILSFFIGYTISFQRNDFSCSTCSNKISHVSVDNSLIQRATNKIDEQAKKIDELLNTIEITSEKLVSLSNSLQKEVVIQLSDKSNSSDVAFNRERNISREIKEVQKIVDYLKLQQSVGNIYSGDIVEREKAIRAMIVIGSSDIRKEIENLIFDPNEDVQLRQAAIDSFDWRGLTDMMIDVFQTDENFQVRSSIIYSARKMNFDEAEREKINQIFYSAFHKETNDSVKIAILDYFANGKTEQFEELVGSVSQEGVSSEVQNHIAFLKKGIISNDNT